MEKRQRSPDEVLSALEDDDLDVEAERSAPLSDAEVDVELARAGVDPEALRAGAGAVFERAMAKRRPRRHDYRRLPVALLAAAAVVCLFIGGYGTRGPAGGGEGSSAPPELRSAESLRAEAAGECAAGQLKACRADLDQARAIDPEGEKEARVVALRRAIATGGADAGS
jgi:hypothetical protein